MISLGIIPMPMTSCERGKTKFKKIYFFRNDSKGRSELKILYVRRNISEVPKKKELKIPKTRKLPTKQCQMCNKCICIYNMNNHIVSCIKNQQKPVECLYCTTRLSNVNCLRRHLVNKHITQGKVKNAEIIFQRS